MKKLTIIIVSYNTKKLLQQTLESIPKNAQWQVVVVDNDSKDGSPDLVAEKFPEVSLIRNEGNFGFAKANNQAIRRARTEYVWLLNSDTVVKPGTIETLIKYMDKHQDVAVVTPKVVLVNGEIDIACHRGIPTPWNSFCYYSGLEDMFPKTKLFAGYHQRYLDLDAVHEIETTAGTAMLVRMKAISDVGMLDERFFMYAEDLDWCLRFRQAGWKIIYHPGATILHLKGQSGIHTKKVKVKRQTNRYFYDTMKQFYEKHYLHKYPSWLKALVFKGIDFRKWLATR